MRGFEPGGQYLRVDCAQVLARTSAQGASEADQIVSRNWRAARPRCRRSVGSLWGRRPLDNLELRLFRSAAGKPASDRAHLTVFQWLPMVLFGGLILCQACAARGCQRWGHQCWCRHQRQERQTCQEGSHRYPQPLRQSAHSARAAPWIYRLVPPAEPMPPLPLTHLGMESSEPTPECQRLTLCLCKELGREKRQGRVPFKPWA